MTNINLKIDLLKLDKARFKDNSYTKRDGTTVTEKNAELVLVEKKEHRQITEGDSWVLKETHFIAEKRGKDEEPNYVGTGSQFFDKLPREAQNEPNTGGSGELTEDEISQIPF